MKKILLLLILFPALIGYSQCVDPLLTDFECGTPSHPFSGGVVVNNVPNPFSGGINTSANVGEATDNGTEPFDAIIVDYGAPIDLMTNPIFHIKVYTELTTPIPFVAKVEGGTTPLEIMTNIDVSDQWLEYTFDFSSVADSGNTTLVIFFNFNESDGSITDTYYIDDIFFAPAEEDTMCVDPILSDFECDLPSHPFSGGVVVNNVPNPFSGGINVSANVGEATDNGTEPFDAIIVDYGAPIDLMTNPIFHIKVYTELTTPIPFVAKVEGGTTPLEIMTNIDVSDQWVEYTFDFSSVADSGNTTLVIFFNFNESDGSVTDTYYIDDLFFAPADTMCVDPILSDFECDLPSHPFSGGVVVNNVPNPFSGGINVSANVGEATDNGTEPFDAIIVDYGAPIDLMTNPIFHIKVYTELTTPIPFVAKVEGGTAPLEIMTNLDVSDQWVEYTFDFSSVADSGNTTLVIFFNFNESDGSVTDTYYIDDLFFAPAEEEEGTMCADPVLSDFECDLPSHPFSGGVVVNNIANPFVGGFNTSANVGEAIDDGTEPLDAIIVDYGAPIDLLTNPIFHIKVYKTITGPIPLVAKVEGGTTPLEIMTVMDVSDQWVEYTFNFSSVADSGNTTLVIFFNFNESDGSVNDTYYIDDLFFAPADSMCEDPIITDFECDLPSQPISGALQNIPNPFEGTANPSEFVGEYTDEGGDAFDNIAVNYTMPIDLSTNNKFRLKIYTSQTTNLLVKLEGGTSPAVELGNIGDQGDNIDELNSWTEYEFDFSDQAGENHERLVLFFNAGNEQDENETFFIDDLRWESESLSINSSDEQSIISIYPNPSRDIIHISSKSEIIGFEMFDISGKNVKKHVLGSSSISRIDISSLVPGLYFLTLKSSTGNQTLKVLKR
ncbi:T9SS C-terminal target domain-containing protein [Dokdonia sinensis]|uniref:T9SS C-terminal target domain-containing protein n=1 Tax=Dokdonia sinensis TaxID=2479847 RepID=A0A3M0GQ64_9FLAO|nr:T9SS type A sorting domain-containing protein [Dokdonia sinensis]RMB59406.1 T9SS C-terminal target domain-containing protein [Dokdonia sinensis]